MLITVQSCLVELLVMLPSCRKQTKTILSGTLCLHVLQPSEIAVFICTQIKRKFGAVLLFWKQVPQMTDKTGVKIKRN